MQQRLYRFDEGQFVKMVRDWYTRKPAWLWCCIGIAVLFLAGLAVPVLLVFRMGGGTAVGMSLAFLAGLIFTAFAWSVAFAVYRLAGRYVGAPYEAMRQLALSTSEAGIQFRYHDRYDRQKPVSAVAWQVAWENIEYVEFNAKNGLITVWGRVERVDFDDYLAKRVRNSFTQGQFGDLYPFSFFQSFEQPEEFRKALEDKGITVKSIA